MGSSCNCVAEEREGNIVRNKRVLVLILALLVLGLLSGLMLSACGSETTDTTAAPTDTTAGGTDTTAGGTDTTAGGTDTTAAATGTFDGEIVVGALGTLTGMGAMNGAEQVWAYNKAVADINAAGGVNLAGKKMELKLKWIDDKSDANEGAAAVEKLIKVEGTKLILSTQTTPINMSAAIVAEKYQAYQQQVITWTSMAREQKWKWNSDLFFGPDKVGEVPFLMVELMPEADRPQNWCILTEDNADGQALGEGVKAMAQTQNINVALYQTYTPGTKDYSSIILKMKQNEIDGIVVLISAADGITFTKQMKEQNFSPKYMMGWKGFWPTEYMKGLGADSDYVCYDAFWSEDLPFPGAKELGEAYRAEHDGLDSVSIGLFYANVQIMKQAIEAAGSTDPTAVRDAVFGGTFKGTAMGDITYDEGGVADIQPLGLQWIGQKRVLIYPDAGNTMEWFKAWDAR
jgi:branched-chain amino acid transport system substrate-binding protein